MLSDLLGHKVIVLLNTDYPTIKGQKLQFVGILELFTSDRYFVGTTYEYVDFQNKHVRDVNYTNKVIILDDENDIGFVLSEG